MLASEPRNENNIKIKKLKKKKCKNSGKKVAKMQAEKLKLSAWFKIKCRKFKVKFKVGV